MKDGGHRELEITCETCQGFGIVAMYIPEVDTHVDEMWRWLVCRPCYGRGFDATTWYYQWTFPTFDRWHRARDIFELLHFSIQVRIESPAHPKDRLVDEEEQIEYQRKRLLALKRERYQIMEFRLRKAYAERQIAM